jgi:hypothetical protein
MDDSFSFRANVPLRRQFDPRVVRAVVFGTLVVLGIWLFAGWVISSERESFSRADRSLVLSEVEARQTDGPPSSATTDAEADEATGIAFTAARTAFLSIGASSTPGPRS